MVANAYLGFAYHALGDYHWAMDFLRRNVAALESDLAQERFEQFGLLSVLSHAWLAGCLAEVGAFAEGIASATAAIRIAETANHPFSLIVACETLGRLYLIKGDLPQAIPVLERSLSLCQEASVPVLLPQTAASLGAAYALAERLSEALPLLAQAVQRAASMGMRRAQALWVVWLGTGYLLAGRIAEASLHARRALEIARARKEQGHQAYALRLLGDIARQDQRAQPEEAEEHYRAALALANELSMRPLLAHCHAGLGMLYEQMGQTESARASLGTASAHYRAMGMAFWLQQAAGAMAHVLSDG